MSDTKTEIRLPVLTALEQFPAGFDKASANVIPTLPVLTVGCGDRTESGLGDIRQKLECELDSMPNIRGWVKEQSTNSRYTDRDRQHARWREIIKGEIPQTTRKSGPAVSLYLPSAEDNERLFPQRVVSKGRTSSLFHLGWQDESDSRMEVANKKRKFTVATWLTVGQRWKAPNFRVLDVDGGTSEDAFQVHTALEKLVDPDNFDTSGTKDLDVLHLKWRDYLCYRLERHNEREDRDTSLQLMLMGDNAASAKKFTTSTAHLSW